MIEAAHDGQGDWRAWGDRLLDAATPLFSSSPVSLGLSRRDEDAYEVMAISSQQRSLANFWSRLSSRLRPAALDPYWRYPKYVGTTVEILARTPPLEDLRSFLTLVEASDILGLVAIVDDVSLSIGAPQDTRIRLQTHERRLLTQVAIHMETGLRLRLHPESAIAFLQPDGRVLHAEGATRRDARIRERLTRHVTRVERTRLRRVRQRPEAVHAWQALVDGRWGLVERCEPGGRRHYVVLETVRGRHLRALSALEAHALELSARGLLGKTVAYAMGVPPATVSKLLGSATLKLGVRNRTKLVQLVAQLLAAGPLRDWETKVSPAERDVLNLVRLGWSNQRIAKSRGRSERTVANQVAALLRKIDVPSRRALATT